MMADGILVIDKPAGVTSADVVRTVKRLGRLKVGHLGTLDPFATGVLPLCLGEGTKLAPFLNENDKEYEGVIRLGRATNTGDPTGEVIAQAPVPALDASAAAAVARNYLGDSNQTPPMHSALKRQGVPLYKLARQGIEVEREPRAIHIADFELQVASDDSLQFRVSCSKGTYVRVLAEDVARDLGTIGHLESLRRTRFGRFSIAQAIRIADLDVDRWPVLGLSDSLAGMPMQRLDASMVERVRAGFEPVLRKLEPGNPGDHAKLLGPDGTLVAVVAADPSGAWHFSRVFAAGNSSAVSPVDSRNPCG